MGIHYSNSKIHWNYFLTIEKDFENLSRYIEFVEDNNSTYSIELARLIMVASQEVDVIMTKICRQYGVTAENINQYKTVIKENIPEIINETVYAYRFGMHSKPWENWNGDENPDWWKANNKIKHVRAENFSMANLKNAFNAIAGLLIVTLYYYKKEIEIENGCSVDWKEITKIIRPKSYLLTLNPDYYLNEFLEWGSF